MAHPGSNGNSGRSCEGARPSPDAYRQTGRQQWSRRLECVALEHSPRPESCVARSCRDLILRIPGSLGAMHPTTAPPPTAVKPARAPHWRTAARRTDSAVRRRPVWPPAGAAPSDTQRARPCVLACRVPRHDGPREHSAGWPPQSPPEGNRSTASQRHLPARLRRACAASEALLRSATRLAGTRLLQTRQIPKAPATSAATSATIDRGERRKPARRARTMDGPSNRSAASALLLLRVPLPVSNALSCATSAYSRRCPARGACTSAPSPAVRSLASCQASPSDPTAPVRANHPFASVPTDRTRG